MQTILLDEYKKRKKQKNEALRNEIINKTIDALSELSPLMRVQVCNLNPCFAIIPKLQRMA